MFQPCVHTWFCLNCRLHCYFGAKHQKKQAIDLWKLLAYIESLSSEIAAGRSPPTALTWSVLTGGEGHATFAAAGQANSMGPQEGEGWLVGGPNTGHMDGLLAMASCSRTPHEHSNSDLVWVSTGGQPIRDEITM